jgi:membrane protein
MAAHELHARSVMTWKDIGGLLKETAVEWFESRTFELGAALAYYAVFSIAPILVIALAIAGKLYGPQAAQGQLFDRLQQMVGPTVAEALEKSLSYSYRSGSGWLATLLGIILLVFGALGVFIQLQASLNAIWKVEPKQGRGVGGVVRDRFVSFLLVLLIGGLLVAALAANAMLAAISQFFPGDALPGGVVLWQGLRWVISFGLLTVLFAIIYKVLPDAKVLWRDVWVGAAVTAGLFTLGNYLIGLYLGRSSVTSTYGAAGSLVVLLLWVYYSSQTLLFGAEFTRVYASRAGHPIVPAENAVFFPALRRTGQPVAGENSPARP